MNNPLVQTKEDEIRESNADRAAACLDTYYKAREGLGAFWKAMRRNLDQSNIESNCYQLKSAFNDMPCLLHALDMKGAITHVCEGVWDGDIDYAFEYLDDMFYKVVKEAKDYAEGLGEV